MDFQFHGSPWLHVDGADPFATPDTPVGLARRIYQTPNGPSGTADINRLREARRSESQDGSPRSWCSTTFDTGAADRVVRGRWSRGWADEPGEVGQRVGHSWV